ncbi:hypothetical protein JCM1841_004787 [Sporobolomyces salmonicolor]
MAKRKSESSASSSKGKGKGKVSEPLAELDSKSFMDAATAVEMELALVYSPGDKQEELKFALEPKRFKAGSIGWTSSHKFDFPLPVDRDDKTKTFTLPCSMTCNITVFGSKHLGAGQSENEGAAESEDEPPKKVMKTKVGADADGSSGTKKTVGSK